MTDIKKRVEWIDIAKDIGMILVIAGHTFQLSYASPIYSFHMPLFFFLTGLVLNVNKYNFTEFFKLKIKQLLKPYFVILIISFLVCMWVPNWRNTITFSDIVKDLYTSNTNVFQNSSLWYLPCLFLSLLIFYIINYYFESSRIKRSLILLFISILVLFIKPILEFIPLPFNRLPFKFDSALIAVVFIAIASWNKQLISKCIDSFFSLKNISIICIITAVFSILNGWANMNSLDFGRVKVLYFPIAFMGIFTICFISSYISKKKQIDKLKSIILFYGRNSLLIFGFQSLFIRLYILIWNHFLNQNMTLYGANPFIHQLGSFVIVTFILSPLIVYLFKSLRKFGINIL